MSLPEALLNGLSLALLATASVTDLLDSRVPNRLTLPVVPAALILNGWAGGPIRLGGSVLGLLVGLALLLPIYALGGIGGGDVKLMAALGCLRGVPFILWTSLGSILAGGILSLALLAYHGRLGRSLGNLGRTMGSAILPQLRTEPLDPRESRGLPFAYAIALAGLWTWLVS